MRDMVFKVETLEDALERLGRLDNRDLILILWTGVMQKCKPMAKAFRLTIPKGVEIKMARDIISAINSKAWVLAILDEHKNVYQILEAERFATKPCGDKNGKKQTKKE